MVLPDTHVESNWAITCFVVLLAFRLAAWLPQREQARRTGLRRATLLREVHQLRLESVRLNTPATFAQCAKCQRQAAAKDKELVALDQSGGASVVGPAWQSRLQSWATKLRIPVQLVLVWVLWRRPLAQLAVAVSSPMAGSLAFPHGRPFSGLGFVSVIPWLLLCDTAGTLAVQLAFPMAALPAPPREAAGSGQKVD